MMMKRFLALLLATCLFISFAACGNNDVVDYDNSENNDSYDEVDETEAAEPTKYVPFVKYISNRKIQYDDDKGYVFLFSFKDASENEIKSPGTVVLKIVNNDGTTVYSATKEVTENDFSTWSNSSGASWLQAAIYINFSEISEGSVANGKFYYQINADCGSTFDEYYLDIDKLPVKGIDIELPSLPKTVSYCKRQSTKITAITYEVKYDDDLYIYFTGEKTYDAKGNGYSDSCKVSWKLYDSEGYTVASGTLYTSAIKVGEKFKNEEDVAYNVIKPGESYKLVIEDTTL